jgi:hypothetical protein
MPDAGKAAVVPEVAGDGMKIGHLEYRAHHSSESFLSKVISGTVVGAFFVNEKWL